MDKTPRLTNQKPKIFIQIGFHTSDSLTHNINKKGQDII